MLSERVAMGLGSTVLDLAALPVAALGTAAAGASALPAAGGDAPRLPRKFWNLALYCSKGLSAADASSGSASRAVVEKRIVTGVQVRMRSMALIGVMSVDGCVGRKGVKEGNTGGRGERTESSWTG